MTAAFRRLFIVGTIASLGLPIGLQAQRQPRPPDGGPGFLFREPRVTLGIRGGFNLRTASDSIYDFFTRELTLGKGDFSAFSIAGDLGITLAGPVDLVLSGGYTRTSHPSEFNNWVDQNSQPITQRTTLWTVPLTLSARLNFASRGRQVGRFVWIPARLIPYLGGGAGMIRYSLTQTGSFVDFQDLSIFQDELASAGWTPLLQAIAGADYSLGKRIFVNADVRYLWANAELQSAFADVDSKIDLSGAQFSVGLHVRI